MNSLSSVRADINVTPLVDVVLVLLIIFMLVTPLIHDQVRLPGDDVFFHPGEASGGSVAADAGIDHIRVRLRIDTLYGQSQHFAPGTLATGVIVCPRDAVPKAGNPSGLSRRQSLENGVRGWRLAISSGIAKKSGGQNQ